MSLDATKIELAKYGSVLIEPSGRVSVVGFAGTNCSCRDVAVLAMAHAIEVLSAELRKTVEQPGGGNVVVD